MGTMKNYMTTQNYVKEFLKKRAKTSDILLAHLSYKFLADFEFYLRAYKPVSEVGQYGTDCLNSLVYCLIPLSFLFSLFLYL